MMAVTYRLCKHGDFQRVYGASRKRFGKQMSYFFLLRQPVNRAIQYAMQIPPARGSGLP